MSPKKWYTISLEGMDKTGKGTILNYLKYLGNFEYVILDRGLMSNIVFSKVYGNRNYSYDVSQYKHVVFVHLEADREDWETRCKVTHEPKIDYLVHKDYFAKEADAFRADGFEVMHFNTTQETAYNIAKKIIRHMDELNAMTDGNKEN